MIFGEYVGTGLFTKTGVEIHDGDILISLAGRDFLVDYCPLEHKWVLLDRVGQLSVLDLYDCAKSFEILGHISDRRINCIAYWEFRYGKAARDSELYGDAHAAIEKRILERLNVDFNLGLHRYSK